MTDLHRNVALAGLLLLAACGPSGNDSTDGGAGGGAEPALETPVETLEAALHCTEFAHPEHPVVLLVHGTFTAGREQYEWNYLPLLSARGFDVCAITYPDRGLGDQQISAEYVVHAVRRIHAQTGRKLAIVGHSQGVSVPRWALRWWPSVRAAVSDFVAQAGPVHGTVVADPTALLAPLGLPLPEGNASAPLLPAAFRQFGPTSQFILALNRDDETPGAVDYTAIYTLTDELVQPVLPVPTAAFEFGQANPRVANFLTQDLCPTTLVDHVTIGTVDRLAFELTIDAITHAGPADFTRAGGMALCLNPLPIIADPALASAGAQTLLTILQADAEAGFPDPHLTTEEPPLKAYAQ
ncbi:esterase/lipase family protein [Arenimonas sp.]|uniref:esterase/lipase family protein n=1 Tax=Arenimonas sp. TaxID=1872635 RepID=UPI002E2EA695|nr:hypothetical protein [Arenimonas sp.]HEX4853631.1 hypothetical protein [Arenimonas sp.]